MFDLESTIDAAMGSSTSTRTAMTALRKRRREFTDNLQMQLTAIEMVPEARRAFDEGLDQWWSKPLAPRTGGLEYDEVIIGGGVHAAIYASCRVASGHHKPLVIERDRIGGVFAVSRRPSFYLNSRNRPGAGGLPSENRALNYVPGAPIQMANLSSSEFQSNADMAFVVRSAIAKHADVKLGSAVVSVNRTYDTGYISDKPLAIELDDGTVVFAGRVIDARGLGDPRMPVVSERVISFPTFMRRMDEPFPLQDMGRVAVIGGGDSGKVTIEALLGIGPSTGMSVPALDWIDQVDWYGRGLPDTCEGWRSQERGRYQGIGSLLRPVDNGRRRLRIFNGSGNVQPGFEMIYVNSRPYDNVIMATGWSRPGLSGGPYEAGYSNLYGFPPQLGRQLADDEVYQIGPAADLEFDEFEAEMSTARIPQNRIALFRLGERTAALASRLP
jgi:hypothetical protein